MIFPSPGGSYRASTDGLAASASPKRGRAALLCLLISQFQFFFIPSTWDFCRIRKGLHLTEMVTESASIFLRTFFLRLELYALFLLYRQLEMDPAMNFLRTFFLRLELYALFLLYRQLEMDPAMNFLRTFFLRLKMYALFLLYMRLAVETAMYFLRTFPFRLKMYALRYVSRTIFAMFQERSSLYSKNDLLYIPRTTLLCFRKSSRG